MTGATVRGALGDRGGEHDFALAGLGLERRLFASARDLAVNADQARVEVDICPGEAECFADAEVMGADTASKLAPVCDARGR